MGEFPYSTLEQLASPEKSAISIGPFGSRMKADTYVDIGVRVIRGTNISTDNQLVGDWVYVTKEFSETIPNCIAHPGDLVFPHRGSIGEVALIGEDEEPLVISSSMMKFRPDLKKVDPRFVAHYFKSHLGREEILRFSSSVGTPGIGQPLTSMRQFRVPTPDLGIQKSIADVLSVLNDKIELNRRTNETLEAMAQAIFRDWFVDFGPVRRKLAGETDPHAILGGTITDPEKAATLAALFPDAFDTHGVPHSWTATPLDEIADFLNGAAMQKFPERPHEKSLPVIKISEMRNGVSEKSNRARFDVPKKYLVNDGDFLFSWSGSLLAKYWTDGQGALNQHLFKVTSETHPMWFVSQWVYFHLREFQIIAESKATTMGHIKREHLTRAQTVCPPKDVLTRLGAVVEPLIEKALKTELESRTLAHTRDYLLPKLMSGEVHAGKTESMVT